MELDINFVRQLFKSYEQISLLCGLTVFAPIAIAFTAGITRELARQEGIDLRSRLLTAYLDLRFGRTRPLDPHETSEITRSDLAGPT